MSSRIVYRRIDVRMYADRRFRELSKPNPSGQFLWIWLLTGPATTIIPGVIVAGPGAISERIGWDYEPTREALKEILDLDMAIADLSAPLIFLPRALRHNMPANPNVVTSWRGVWAEIPECPLKARIWKHIHETLSGCAESIVEAFKEACPKPNNDGETRVYDTIKRKANRNPNGSRNGSANGSRKGSPNPQDTGSGNSTPNQEQDSGDRRQETGDRRSLVFHGVPV